jgi:hypothetical protein
MVNLLLTNSIKVNVPSSDASRLLTTGDDHEVQESTSGHPRRWIVVVAVRLRLERRGQHGLIEFRPNSADFREIQTIYGSAWIVFSHVRAVPFHGVRSACGLVPGRAPGYGRRLKNG